MNIRPIDANAIADDFIQDSKDAGFYRPIYEGAARRVQAAPTLDYAPRQQWISVGAEVKPKHGKEYLCVCTLPNDPKHEWDWLAVLRWHMSGSNGYVDRPHFTNEGYEGMTVTHWMPLPELPKEE